MSVGKYIHAAILVLFLHHATCAELSFMLEAKDEMCFYEQVKSGEETVLEFQVINLYSFWNCVQSNAWRNSECYHPIAVNQKQRIISAAAY